MSVYEVTFQMSWSPFILEIELSVLGDPVYASTIRMIQLGPEDMAIRTLTAGRRDGTSE